MARPTRIGSPALWYHLLNGGIENRLSVRSPVSVMYRLDPLGYKAATTLALTSAFLCGPSLKRPGAGGGETEWWFWLRNLPRASV